MIFYLDTSFLIKLYIFEGDSQDAVAILQTGRYELVISWLSEVEMASALHAKPELHLSADDAAKAYTVFRRDADQGLYKISPVDRDVFDLARSLGEKHGRGLRVRALDVLHVAAADGPLTVRRSANVRERRYAGDSSTGLLIAERVRG